MTEPRSFGVPPGQLISRDPIAPDLFMRVGTRVGTITAYYEYVNPPNTVPNIPKPQESPSIKSIVKIPTVRFAPAITEEVIPAPKSPVYDTPKKI